MTKKTLTLPKKNPRALNDVVQYATEACNGIQAYQERTSKPKLPMQIAFENAIIKSKHKQAREEANG